MKNRSNFKSIHRSSLWRRSSINNSLHFKYGQTTMRRLCGFSLIVWITNIHSIYHITQISNSSEWKKLTMPWNWISIFSLYKSTGSVLCAQNHIRIYNLKQICAYFFLSLSGSYFPNVRCVHLKANTRKFKLEKQNKTSAPE